MRNPGKTQKFISGSWPTCLFHPPSALPRLAWSDYCKVARHSLKIDALAGMLARGMPSPLLSAQIPFLPGSSRPAAAAWESLGELSPPGLPTVPITASLMGPCALENSNWVVPVNL